MPEALDMCDNFTALNELQLFSPLEDTPLDDLQVGRLAVGQQAMAWSSCSTLLHDACSIAAGPTVAIAILISCCLVSQCGLEMCMGRVLRTCLSVIVMSFAALQSQASTAGAEASAGPVRSGWTSWAAAGLSTLGLFGGSANSNSQDLRASISGSLGCAGHNSDDGLAKAGSANILPSPLAQDWHQRSLVKQAYWKQHEAAHKQHLQDQHSMQDASAAHSQHLAVSTLQDKQLLPAAVRSFQRHKIMRAESLFGGSSSSAKDEHAGLDWLGTEPWSPTWLLRSFVPFGSPVSPSALSTADSLMGQQQRQSSWGLLDACRVSAAHSIKCDGVPSECTASCAQAFCHGTWNKHSLQPVRFFLQAG